MLQLTMTKPRKTIDFFTCTVQEAFHDISVVISRNKPQTKSAIFKLNYYLIQANNKKIIYTMDHYNLSTTYFGTAVDKSAGQQNLQLYIPFLYTYDTLHVCDNV